MKEKTKRVRTKFAREVRFEVEPAPLFVEQNSELERLKNRLLEELLDQATNPEENVLLRRAANDAASLAWINQFPLLLFPGLLEEKARTALIQRQRQRQVRDRSRNLLLEAA